MDLRICIYKYVFVYIYIYTQAHLYLQPGVLARATASTTCGAGPGALAEWALPKHGLSPFIDRYPEGACAQYFRTLVPNTIEGMVFETRNLKYLVLGPSGIEHMMDRLIDRQVKRYICG